MRMDVDVAGWGNTNKRAKHERMGRASASHPRAGLHGMAVGHWTWMDMAEVDMAGHGHGRGNAGWALGMMDGWTGWRDGWLGWDGMGWDGMAH